MTTMTHMVVDFASGPYVIVLDSPETRVRAVRRAEHGDWKTQLARSEFMGMAEGEEGDLDGVFDNCYGRWCRVKIGDRYADIHPRDLEAIPAP